MPDPLAVDARENHSARILLVEDEFIVAMDVQHRLEMLGYVVPAHAGTGEEALDCAANLDVDLVLMDIRLQGKLDGIETAAKIRESFGIPTIYLTAFADEATLKRARLTGAFGYLIKPFEDRELRSTIEMALYTSGIEKKLRDSEERYALAARAANDGIWDWNLVNDTIYYSPRWADMLGLDHGQLSSAPAEWLTRVHPEDRDNLTRALHAHFSGSKPTFECEYRMEHQDGSHRWMLCRGLALFDAHRRPYRLAGSQADITTRVRFEQELIHKALHDELTGLPNRALFVDRLNKVLEQSWRASEKISAVLFLDLDHFKFVNDSFGHGHGDHLLVQIARRLEHCLRFGDTVSRFGGDEFAILLDTVADEQEAHLIAGRIQAELEKPFLIGDRDHFISASIGILLINGSYQSPEEILRDVDTAMYSAKNKGRARFEVFNLILREQTLHHLAHQAEMRGAVARQEFLLHYQPIFSTSRQHLMGFEALVRWQHPVRGLILPGEFISTAEETRLIIPIGDWVLRTACSQAVTWNSGSSRPLTMSVNISRIQLVDENFVQKVLAILKETGLNPELLELEITESVAMENVDLTFDRLQRLCEIGVRVAIDDFGCGYSSLDHLKRFPANTLKIDRSFIDDIQADDLAIVSAMIQMAHQLRLKVIGEGVETETQLSILAKLECDDVQGFLWGKPQPPHEISKKYFHA